MPYTYRSNLLPFLYSSFLKFDNLKDEKEKNSMIFSLQIEKVSFAYVRIILPGQSM